MILATQKNLIEFIAKNDLEFSEKNVIFILSLFGPKSLLGERFAKVVNYNVLKPRKPVLQTFSAKSDFWPK